MTTKVLYITGWCRSGSTLLGNLLGELPGVTHVGEAHYLWRNGVLRCGTNTSCGCGAEVCDCPVWSAVLRRWGDDAAVAPATAQAAMDGQQRYLRTRHTGRRLAEATGRRTPSSGAEAAVERVARLHHAIADVTGARLVVDGSKYPAEAAALCGRRDLDVRVLHLVRHPCATAYSWQRAKAYIPAMGTARSTAYWSAFNVASERIGRAFPDRYLFMRYEDFTADPVDSLRLVLKHVGLDDDPPMQPDGTARLGVNHTVTGNPDRFASGVVTVRPDEAWRTGFAAPRRALVSAVAGPLRHRYGYR